VISIRVDNQLHYVDLNEVVSRLGNDSNQANKSLTLKDFVQKINLASIVPRVESYDVRSKFDKSYWCGICEEGDFFGNRSKLFVCKSRAKLDDGFPGAQLLLTKNSDLYNIDPERYVHLLKDNLLYLVLRGYEYVSSGICLATFRLDDKANTFTKVCSEKFDLPEELVLLNSQRPILGFRSCYGNFDVLIAVECTVFSVARPSPNKNLLWIHCFMKNKIFPIGGANTNVPGLYSLNPKIELYYQYYDGNFVGLFGLDEFHSRRGNDRIYKTWRYVLA
jgi:hypothetical protein